MQALLKDSSHVLHKALDQKAYFKSVIIVVPSSWRDSKCQTIIRPPREGTPYQNADIVVSGRCSSCAQWDVLVKKGLFGVLAMSKIWTFLIIFG